MKFIKLETKDLSAIFLFFLMITLEFYSKSFIPATESGKDYYIGVFILAIRLSYVIILFRLYGNIFGKQWKAFKQNFWKNALICLGLAVLTLVLMQLAKSLITPNTTMAIVEDSSEEENLIDLPWKEFSLMLTASLIPLCAPFFEEIIFRHILFFKQADSKIKFVFYIILSSFLFGVFHYSNAGGFIDTIPYMIMGAYFATLYWWKKNIWFNIGAHFIYNFTFVAIGSLLLLIFKVLGVGQ